MIKNKLIKTFAIIMVTIAMLLATLGLSACNGYRENMLHQELLEQMALLQQQIYTLQNNSINTGDCCNCDNTDLLAQIEKLENSINIINGQLNAMQLELHETITSLEKQLNELQRQLEALKNFVQREWGYSECGRFALSIWTTESSLTFDELYFTSFNVYAELKNLTGKDIEITVSALFWPYIPNWRPLPLDLPMYQTITFPKNSSIRKEPVLHYGDIHELRRIFRIGSGGYGDEGGRLPIGIHELSFTARFGFDETPVAVLSNIVLLIVN